MKNFDFFLRKTKQGLELEAGGLCARGHLNPSQHAVPSALSLAKRGPIKALL